MYDNVLFIVGNGFDLHHEVKSSYYDFRDYLKKHDYKLFDQYERYCTYNNLWSNFETSLAFISRDMALALGEPLIPPTNKGDDDLQIADILLAGDFAGGELYEMLNNLKRNLHLWISNVHASRYYSVHKIRMDYEARFLTFNYTRFLQTEYGIPRENIKYIHGSCIEPRTHLIVGHGEDNQEVLNDWVASKKKEYRKVCTNKKGKRFHRTDFSHQVLFSSRSLLPEYEMLSDSVDDYYNEAKKDTDKIICVNGDYFTSLTDIKYIYVLGHSLSKVDLPYFRKIHEQNNAVWYVSYHDLNDKERFMKILNDIGIPLDQIKMIQIKDMLQTV
ncbi:MAG TPA: bacteriophage abortive infection AbiH family protein [Paludibacter sp.]